MKTMLRGHSLEKLIAVAELLDAHPELWENITAGYRVGYERALEDFKKCLDIKVCDKANKIEFPKFASTDGGLDMQGEPAQQPTYTGEEKPF